MKFRKTALAATTLAAGAFLAIAVPLSASAHVEVEPSSTAAGSGTLLTFSLPHGCDGSPTTAIAIDIPEQITSVTPTVNPNWAVKKVPVDLAKPLDDGHGNTITTRIGKVVYTAKEPLADGLRDTFTLSLRLPDDAAGTTLEFPVLQTCETGQTEWNEKQPDGGAEPEHPVPAITVTAAGTAQGEEGATDAAAASPTADAAASGASASSAPESDDVLARVLGIAGLVVGAAGVVLAVAARRRA